jgi:S-adenosylmethionine:tRNA ribosyltransferase-isomerase
VTALAFELPDALEAREPPEARGIVRDGVKLLVASRANRQISHHSFDQITDILRPGDLLVINVSATLPAALRGTMSNGSKVTVHVSTRAPRLDQRWRVVEIRSADGTTPLGAHTGESIALDGGASLQLVAAYASGARLTLARFEAGLTVEEHLGRHGRPISYGFTTRRWPLSAYQNVYARTAGSAEMASAGRPFTTDLITRLVARGVLIAPLVLHTGVSSPEAHEPPFPEQYSVPEKTAAAVGAVKAWGGRVIAVGTTVVRALETAADEDGSVRARSGWTGLVINPERGVRIIDGLITGWHEPAASHLQMLAATAGEDLLERSYQEALERGYLWHEFGDSHLILR